MSPMSVGEASAGGWFDCATAGEAKASAAIPSKAVEAHSRDVATQALPVEVSALSAFEFSMCTTSPLGCAIVLGASLDLVYDKLISLRN
jgi:hypothetical protein